MNINLTLFGQMIAFGLFVWFCFKYVWPPLTTMLEERRARIDKGLRDAAEAEEKKRSAAAEAEQTLEQARAQAAEIVQRANRQAASLVEEARAEAKDKADRLLAAADEQVELEVAKARDRLRDELGDLVAQAAGRVVGEQSAKASKKLIQEYAERF